MELIHLNMWAWSSGIQVGSPPGPAEWVLVTLMNTVLIITALELHSRKVTLYRSHRESVGYAGDCALITMGV